MKFRPLKLKRMILIALLLLVDVVAHAAMVSAKLDRQNVVVGETVTLTLQADDTGQSMDTDLSALKADFEVLDQRSETQMSFVNGQKTAFVRMVVTLEPKHAGELTIPALNFPGARSPALQLHVSAAPQRAPGEPEPVFIDLQLQPASGPYYVHSQVGLTVRIFYQTNLTEAAINPPAPKQALVRLLDEVPYQAQRNGVEYRVLERHYAIFPERSGSLQVPPMQLTGRLIERAGGRLWQPSVRGRRVRVQSDPVNLEIKPQPAEFTGAFWLPARRITLSQKISDTKKLHVGEPLTRTIIMDAVGLEENMLEEPQWPDLPDTRIYPDQPQGISRDDGQWVLGHKEFRYAVVPEKPGELFLPEVRLDWWDTVANRQRTAVLPEQRVSVLPSELAVTPTVAPFNNQSANVGLVATPGAVNFAAGGRMLVWQSGTAVFAILWLLTLYFFYRYHQLALHVEGSPDTVSPDEASLLKKIRQACEAGDAATTRSVLSRWVRHFAPTASHTSMRDYANACGDAILRQAVDELDVAGFGGKDPVSWQGSDLWAAFERCQRGTPSAKKTAVGEQPKLYPSD